MAQEQGESGPKLNSPDHMCVVTSMDTRQKIAPNGVSLYVSPVPEELHCPVCWEILDQAVWIPCGHTFCKACIQKSIQSKKECPLCKAACDEEEPKVNLLLTSMIDNLQVYCKYGLQWNEETKKWEAAGHKDDRFCSAILKRSLRHAHELQCEYSIQRCDYWALGCEVQIAKRFAKNHRVQCAFPLVNRSQQENMSIFRSLENKIANQDKQMKELQQQNAELNQTVLALCSFLQAKYPGSEELNALINERSSKLGSEGKENDTQEAQETPATCKEVARETPVPSRDDKTLFYQFIESSRELGVVHSLPHGGDVESLAQSGEYLITSSWDGTISLWHTKDFDHSGTLECTSGQVRHILINEDLLYCACSDGYLSVWDVELQEKRKEVTIPTNGDILSQVIVQDVIFTSSVSSEIYCLDKHTLHTKRRVATSHTNWIFALERCNQYVISGSSDSTIKVWDIESFELIYDIQGHHSDQIRCLQALDENTFAAGSYDKTISLWDTRSKGAVGEIECNSEVFGLGSFGRLLFSGEGEGSLHVWDSQNFSNYLSKGLGHTEQVYDFEVVGNSLVSASADGLVKENKFIIGY